MAKSTVPFTKLPDVAGDYTPGKHAVMGPDGKFLPSIFALPPDDGSPNQYLRTDGSGATTWATPASVDAYFEHNQNVAASVWTVTHNLGKFPAVSVVDSAGSVVVGEVSYVNVNTLILTFSGSFAGKAYCN